MNQKFQEITLKATKAEKLVNPQVIQSLWSGYGKIVRYGLEGADVDSVVVKHVKLRENGGHPRGWDTDLSHQRKLRSYEVETEWYKKWASHCDDLCRIPHCLALEWEGDEVLMVLEDLDAAGFPRRFSSVSWSQIEACLKWLANFHATFMGERPEGLWPIGTYWHLDTRPDELNDLDDTTLKQAASKIDATLNNAKYLTFVHGDAKLANFCFSQDGNDVSAVDFQYVGGGCGMKDVAYFIGSCLYEDDCEKLEDNLLDCYFSELKEALAVKQPDLDADDVEKEWRLLFPVAWTDFHRFIKGWSPGHWKINSYSERVAKEVVASL